MLEKILKALKLTKKEETDKLEKDLNCLKEELRQEQLKNKELKNMIVSMCRETHIVYETQKGNNFVYLSKETLEESQKYNLVEKVDMYNRKMLIAEKRKGIEADQ